MTHFRTAAIAAFALASLLPAQDDGPTHVIVTHRVYPEKRAPFRNDLAGQIQRLAHWRDDGAIAGLQILTTALIDDEAWEALVIAKTGTRGVELWKRVDQLNGVASTTTVPVDLTESGGDADAPAQTGVFLVIPYECGTPMRVAPLVDSSLKEGTLLGFRYFVPRFAGGRSWNVLLVLHYPDWLTLGRRATTAWRDNQSACREKLAVIAEATLTK